MSLVDRRLRETDGTLQGRHVLMILATFFGVVFAVNGIFLVAAIWTHAGIVANEPYRKGLAYNSRVAAQMRQTDLGWSDTTTAARAGTIDVQLTDRDGSAVKGLSVIGTIGRPSTASQDRSAQFLEASPGNYIANVASLEAGSWIVSIEARRMAHDVEPVYRMRRRLWLNP